MNKRDKQVREFLGIGKSERAVIECLAENPNVTPYKIEKKTMLTHSTVNYLINGKDSLIDRGFAAVVSYGDWKNTGMQKRVLRLSLKGLILYFAFSHVPSIDTNPDSKLAKKNRDIEEKLKGVISEHGDLHVVFKHWVDMEKAVEFKRTHKLAVFSTHLSLLNQACISTLQYTHFWNLENVGVKAFRESYPLALLDYDGGLLFHFLGLLRGTTTICKPIPAFYQDSKPIIDRIEKMVSDIKIFNRGFATP